MKVQGQNIPSADLFMYQGSLQEATPTIGPPFNNYGTFKYGQGKYGSRFYVRLRYPFQLPTMKGEPPSYL